jgi:hypothetical protein
LQRATVLLQPKPKDHHMRKTLLAIGMSSVLVATSTSAATFEWVNGDVTGITAQLPSFTVFVVDKKTVRFCSPINGIDYKVSAVDLHYDLLKTALANGKPVQVGVQNYGNDPQSGDVKRCIDRVILSR